MTRRYRMVLEVVARYGGLLAVLFEWLAVGYFYIHRPDNYNGEQTISYFATNPQTRIVFSICFALAALSILLFVRLHLRKHFAVPVRLLTFASLSFLAMALIPFNPHDLLSNTVHTGLAFACTVAYILAMYKMARLNTDPLLRRYSLPLAITAGLLCVVMFITQESSFFIVLEVLTGFLCQLWVIGVNLQILGKSRS